MATEKIPSAPLREQIETIARDLTSLAETLRKAATDLEHGTPPPVSLAKTVSGVRDAFDTVATAIVERASEAGISEEDPPATIEALQALREQIERKASVRLELETLLNRVLSLQHRDNEHFDELSGAYEAAKELKTSLAETTTSNLPEKLKTLLQGQHALNALISLVEQQESSVEARWEAMMQVSDVFGKPLALSALGGQLVFAEEETLQKTQEQPAEVFEKPTTEAEEEVAAVEETLPEIEAIDSAEEFAEIEEASADKAELLAETNQGVATEAEEVPVKEIITEDEPASVTEEETPGEAEVYLVDEEVITQDSVVMQVPAEVETEPEAETPTDEEDIVQEEEEEQAVAIVFPPEATSHEIATALVKGKAEDRDDALSALVWRLLREGHAGYAYHIASSFEEKRPTCPPAWLIRAATMGPHLRLQDGALVLDLQENLLHFSEDLFVEGGGGLNTALRLLLYAALFRPALHAPIGSMAPDILQALHAKKGFAQTHAFSEAIAEFSNSRMPVPPVVFVELGIWDRNYEALRAEVEQWWQQAQEGTTSYQRATEVWKQWIKEGALIGRVILAILQNDRDRASRVRKAAELLADEKHMQREVDRTSSGRKRITGGALQTLVRRAGEASAYAKQWLALLAEIPEGETSQYGGLIRPLKTKLMRLHEKVEDELEQAQKQEDLRITAVAGMALVAIRDVMRLFTSDTVSVKEPTPGYLLNSDLLLVPGIMLTEAWEPEKQDNLVPQLLETLSSPRNWKEVFDARMERRDHEGTARIIELLQTRRDHGLDLDALRRERDIHIDKCREALLRETDDAEAKVSNAFTDGLLREEERTDLIARLERIRQQAQTTLRFYEEHDALQNIYSSIATKREDEVKKIRIRLASEMSLKDPVQKRIEEVLERGDIHTATDYIERTLRGESLPEEGTPSAFDVFFPNQLQAINKYLESEKNDLVQMGQKIKTKGVSDNATTYDIGPVTIQETTVAQIAQVGKMLETWFKVKRQQNIREQQAEAILTGLGFDIQELTVERDRRTEWIDVVVDTPAKRDCPVPAYGSEVDGRYRILCVKDEPNEIVLTGRVKSIAVSKGMLVFYFGRLPDQTRRALARLSREESSTFLVLDDSLLLFLCGQPSPRLRALFECTLPFTFTEPYKATSGRVAPEMFYGRQQEVRDVLDPDGSSLIYGGRQLGKSALFTHVERMYHHPPHTLIKYIDLNAEGIGRERTPDAIRPLLVREFKKMDVFEEDVPERIGYSRLRDHILAWLKENQERRILLLLDEADRYFESDSKNDFNETRGLKNIMEATVGRFKVVFAGLHNVLRTTELSNHPLAHLKPPICIGPLDPREAQALIEEPLKAMGYRFKFIDLVGLILSWTNYYPSLAQLYCRQLLEDLNNPREAAFNAKNSPPYRIDYRHVKESYNREYLVQLIRDRFQWTLRLDQRYEVIAYAIANECLEESGQNGLVEGFTVQWVREQVPTYYPEGFRGSASHHHIHVLMEEMVGLGVLQKVQSDNGDAVGRYTLRSPNVLSLLGSREAIAEELLRERIAPPEYDPSTFRSSYEGMLAPLTAAQVETLRGRQNGVSVIVGNDAAGLDLLTPFLRKVLGTSRFSEAKAIQSHGEFAQTLEQKIKGRKEGTSLLLIQPATPWDFAWVEEAINQTNRLVSPKSFFHVLFVADPERTWALIKQDTVVFETLNRKGAVVSNLGPWHEAALRQWLQDWEFGKQPKERVTELTGNWFVLLKLLYEHADADKARWKAKLEEIAQQLRQPAVAESFLPSFGLNDSDRQRVLHNLAVFDEGPAGVSAVGLAAVLDDVDESTIRQTLHWADALGLVNPVGEGNWHIDQALGSLLRTLEL